MKEETNPLSELTANARHLKVPTIDEVRLERKRIKHRAAYRKALRGTVYALLMVAALAVLISSLILPVMQISGESMNPTLVDGEIIVLLKIKNLKPGDLCSFTWNNRTLIKRIIAGPGDWVVIDEEGHVTVNDVPMDEPYVSEPGLGECDIEFPYQVPEDSYFAMGDKRSSSIDSRSTVIGCIHKDQIIGQVWLRVYPLKRIGLVDREWR